MKAAQYSQYGGPEVITIPHDAPVPVLKDAQVLVKVHTSSANPFDYKVRQGYMKDMIPLHFPVTIGGDFAGIITEVGSGVTGFAAGDEVYGQALIVNGGSGSFAEQAAANIKNISHKPKKTSFVEAASLPLVGSSAIQALEEHIKLTKDKKILIHGGAGGIGSIAIQVARHIGARVITTVSTDDIEFVKKLGADTVIDYKTQKFEEMVHDIDAVFDTVGGAVTTVTLKVLKKGGILVTMAEVPDEELTKEHGVTAIAQNTGVNQRRLQRLAELVDSGVITPQIDKVFSLDQAREAFEHLETGHPRGKVVVEITK